MDHIEFSGHTFKEETLVEKIILNHTMKIYTDDINAEGSVQTNQEDREPHSSNLYEVIVEIVFQLTSDLLELKNFSDCENYVPFLDDSPCQILTLMLFTLMGEN
ncbi:hypothetical protein DUI87_17981 [Hirundo rustica rustica]|uniref:Uncharacterized protein n=1 Tax=Hirundo rustica rustica TaxID=333673 RepID=A0A3M0JVE5_HIRRU|nr:hypothetical protein DUI87_17981 [Hirundo rustica rustica]